MTSLGEALDALAATIEARRGADSAQSYTATLLQGGPALCAKKLGEEAVETVIACVSGERAALAHEAADLLYHLLVALEAAGCPPGDVAAALEKRQGVSGHAEKASRGQA